MRQSRKTYTYIYPYMMKKLRSNFDFWCRIPVLFCNSICGGRLSFIHQSRRYWPPPELQGDGHLGLEHGGHNIVIP